MGFSGFEAMRNRPQFEDRIMAGPIPRQTYRIYQPKRWNDSWIMRLNPGIPGPRNSSQNFYLKAGDISKGCINIPKDALPKVVELVRAGDNTLQVTI